MMGITKKFKKEEVLKFPFGSKECGDFLKDSYINSIDDVISLDDSLYDYILEYDVIVDEIKNLENAKKVIEHRIQNELREHECGFCKDRKITWKRSSRSSFDSKKLKLDMPDIYDKYVRVSVSRAFKIK